MSLRAAFRRLFPSRPRTVRHARLDVHPLEDRSVPSAVAFYNPAVRATAVAPTSATLRVVDRASTSPLVTPPATVVGIDAPPPAPTSDRADVAARPSIHSREMRVGDRLGVLNTKVKLHQIEAEDGAGWGVSFLKDTRSLMDEMRK